MMRFSIIIISESAYFSMRDVAHLLLRYIKEIQYAVVAHNSQPAIPLIKCNCLDSFIDFDLCKAELTVEVLADHF